MLQETHAADSTQLIQDNWCHHALGTATYARSDIENALLISITNSIHKKVIFVGGIKIITVYKSPTITWDNELSPTWSHAAIYCGDFNTITITTGDTHTMTTQEIRIPIIKSIPKPRWNFMKAKWDNFKTDLDKSIRFIPTVTSNHSLFVGLVISTAKKHIPRGFCKEYIPGWSETCEKLYDDFLVSGETEVVDDLLNNLDAARLSNWKETTENMNFTHSSRKAWSVLRKLAGANQCKQENPQVKPEAIAGHMVRTS
ncbi:hypothetical protein J437_LFUL014546 [Ladona fulva]|uniref:Uncharacterized protein n=1 Tax=Ladona fulva TaxID=123851 RepID=A0A8K0KM36_LADFU|nr:hypothetical protein J437_LFUL014546 [Ladona fulva]